jgi:hypothetical protein
MDQNEIIAPGSLLDVNGRLSCPGFAYRPLLAYNRARIKASALRIKEWDYYLINDDRFAVALTIGDMGYAGMLSASVIDFSGAGSTITDSIMTPLPLGRFRLPSSSDKGTAFFENDRVSFEFSVKDCVRELHVRFKRFAKKDDELVVDARLDEQPHDSMVIATPWKEDPAAFYYNRKIIGMRVAGSFKIGRELHGFEPHDSFGLLDWGRGVWTRDNTWYWGFAQGWQDGRGGSYPDSHRFGLNFGYGFGDTAAASENMVFVDGSASKLGRVRFDIPVNKDVPSTKPIGRRFRLLEPWHIVDDEGAVDLVFSPLCDRSDFIDFGVVVSDQHQVFGRYDGTVVVDGSPFAVRGLRGAAEAVHNRY